MQPHRKWEIQHGRHQNVSQLAGQLWTWLQRQKLVFQGSSIKVGNCLVLCLSSVFIVMQETIRMVKQNFKLLVLNCRQLFFTGSNMELFLRTTLSSLPQIISRGFHLWRQCSTNRKCFNVLSISTRTSRIRIRYIFKIDAKITHFRRDESSLKRAKENCKDFKEGPYPMLNGRKKKDRKKDID